MRLIVRDSNRALHECKSEAPHTRLASYIKLNKLKLRWFGLVAFKILRFTYSGTPFPFSLHFHLPNNFLVVNNFTVKARWITGIS